MGRLLTNGLLLGLQSGQRLRTNIEVSNPSGLQTYT